MATAKKLPSGTWRVLIYVGKDENGKKIYKSITAPTKRQCELLAAEYRNDHTTINTNTVGSLLRDYINLKSQVLSPATIRGLSGKASIMAKHYDYLYNCKLSNFNEKIFQRFINDMLSDHKRSTVKEYVATIAYTLKHYKFPIPDFTLPAKERPDIVLPSEKDTKRILEAVKDTELEVPVLLALFGPMRRGEICALTLDDIKGNVVHVNKTRVRTVTNSEIDKIPKTYYSDRYIEYPSHVTDLIRKKGYVTNYSLEMITKSFQKVVEKLGIKHFSFHGLRHLSVSMLHGMGIPDEYIIKRGGWSSSATFRNVYRHSISDYTEEMTKRSNAIFSKLLD